MTAEKLTLDEAPETASDAITKHHVIALLDGVEDFAVILDAARKYAAIERMVKSEAARDAREAIDIALRDSVCVFDILRKGKPDNDILHLLAENCQKALKLHRESGDILMGGGE